jgi:spore maturation protein CgeB
MRVLLVSDYEHYATRNVFLDYLAAFQKCGIDVQSFDMAEYTRLIKDEAMYYRLYSRIMLRGYGITHVLFITGTNVPVDIIESISTDIKVGVIGTDDPHSSKAVMERFASRLDYYFTNERKMHQYDERFHYIPIASSSTIPNNISDNHLSDVCFVGSVYPNRIPMLETITKWCIKNGKKPLFVGPQRDVPADSIIKPVSREIIVDNQEAMRYYAGARVSVNLDRDVYWSSATNTGVNDTLFDVGIPYSTNPRTYEIPLNRSIQLFINPRQEAVDTFDDSIFVTDDKNIEETLQRIFDSPKSETEAMKAKAFEIAQHNTYENRANRIIKILMEG